MLFQTGVSELRWLDDERRWLVSTDRGDAIRARFVIRTNGILDRPKLPGIPGIADFKGRTVLLNLWATWCAPCRAEMPELDALKKEKGGPAFQVVAVNADTGGDDKPRKLLSETGASTLTYYSEHSMALFNELKDRGLALGLPVTLMIDKDGCMLTHMNGPAAWASAEAKSFVEAAAGG